MTADIVPIELGLTEGNLVTLWAPNWREDGEEWQAFLGLDDDLYGFDTVADLVAFVRGGAANDLEDHPRWPVVRELSAGELEPDEDESYDLVGALETAAGDLDEERLDSLRKVLEITRTIGEVCDLRPVNEFFSVNPGVQAVFVGVEPFYGREGAHMWSRVGKEIAAGWDDVLNAIDEVVTTPKVDGELVTIAQAELDAPEPSDQAAPGNEEIDDDVEDLDDDTPEDDTETFWDTVGIDPIRIITTDNTFVTLRCWVDDAPIFLGRQGRILVFGSERALARYLADEHDHDLAGLSTYAEVHTAALDGSLDVEVADDNVYVLPGMADDLAAGPDSVDSDQLELNVELFSDAAEYAGDNSVTEELATNTSLGWYVSYLLEPDADRLEPSPPFASQAEAWRRLEEQFESRLRRA